MKTPMRLAAWLLLGSLSLLTACPNRKTEPAGPEPDYDGARESSKRGHQSLDKQKVGGQE